MAYNAMPGRHTKDPTTALNYFKIHGAKIQKNQWILLSSICSKKRAQWPFDLQYRIAGNFRENPVSLAEEIFEFSMGYWPRPFIVTGITVTEDVPWERVGGRLSVWIGTVLSSDRPRLAHKTHAWKFLHVQKFTQKFAKFSRFLFLRFGCGSRRSRKFGARENIPLYSTCFWLFWSQFCSRVLKLC